MANRLRNGPELAVCVVERQLLAAQVMRLFLQPVDGKVFSFQPGQYLDILHQESRRSFSLAGAPRSDGLLELHIRRIPGNTFTDYVFEELQTSAVLHIAGPFGDFTLRPHSRSGSGPGSSRRRVFLAGGTGFAPIKSFIEHLSLENGCATLANDWLYWGARLPEELYLHALARSWQQRHGLRYVPVVSHLPAGKHWPGRTGWVHEAVMADHPDLASCEVYACGPPAMIKAARTAFLERGLPARFFYTEG